jgi:GDP-4-dehydro-6-deoxy-D-mannose reductase
MSAAVTPQRYLLTGAQGFIGRHLTSELLGGSQDTVLAVGRSARNDSSFNYSFSCGNLQIPAKLPAYLCPTAAPKYKYAAVDIVSEAFCDIVADFRPTRVIHLAATLRGVTDVHLFQNNVQSTASLLRAIARSNVEMLLFASSGGVYGKQTNFPIDESAAPAPLDSYSRSKLASEDLVMQFASEHKVPTAVARIFNAFGPGQDELHFAGRMAGQIACILAGKARASIRTGALSSTRDFLDVRDVSRALALIVRSNLQGIFNVGSGTETRVYELLKTFLDSTHADGLPGKSIRFEADPTLVDPIPRHVANINRLASNGFVPRYSLERSCEEMLAYAMHLFPIPGV